MKAVSLGKLLLILLCSMLLVIGSASCGQEDDDDDDASDDDDAADDDDVSDDDDDDDDNDDNDDDTMPETTDGYVFIPAGSFSMGSPENELGRRQNENLHPVTLTHCFEMKRIEVTQGEFEQLAGFNPSHFPIFGDGPLRPVESVSFFDALAFANGFSQAQGLAPCYLLTNILCTDETAVDDADDCKDHGGIADAKVDLCAESVVACEGFRLPTEAEWEYAARAQTTTATYNGDIESVSCYPVDPNLDPIAWYCGNSERYTHPVAGKSPNPWGLFDMLGNVKEWTWDRFAHELTGAQSDPTGPGTGRYRVVRGGAARFHGAAFTRAAFRTGHTPDQRMMTLGFRLIRTLDQTPADPSDKSGALVLPARQARKAASAWPDELPFAYSRPAIGTPLTQQEIDDFTERITGFWKQTQYFHRYRWLSHGMNADNPQQRPDYKLFLQVSQGTKSGNLVEIRHTGSSDNLMIRTGKIFNNAAALYLATDDDNARYLVEQYCKGLMAMINGFVWSEDDPEPWIMPRTIFPENHYYEEEGREVYVNYDPIKQYKYDWNGWTIPNDGNPTYGDIWVRTHRSKDDVPHIYRMVPHLYRLIEQAPDPEVVQVASQALNYMEQWNRDIVHAGYYIRTKDEQGDTYVPMNDDNPIIVNDLASFVCYDPLVPDAECNAELSSALIAYNEPLGNDCDDGTSLIYDFIASYQHYFNDRNIIRIFHIDAVIMALMHGYDDAALDLLKGLAKRTDHIFDNSKQGEHRSWDADTASFLLASATAGLPLTDREAQHIQQEYEIAMDHYLTWPYWDLWDASVPDGEVPIRPSSYISEEKDTVRSTEMAYFIEYCSSPFRNETGKQVVNCDVVLNPVLWGEPISDR